MRVSWLRFERDEADKDWIAMDGMIDITFIPLFFPFSNCCSLCSRAYRIYRANHSLLSPALVSEPP
ncbi:hypothetical protein M413DRAFT_346031 [Hebeloma cylindrosporum]|uniref:Uncharacterized protein n=1 Tax=Hebeloma cylindrosporum TaxID=76867 RepID=A0A0C2Y7A4_HEBCY|nr:hypothetical protein M413DRAFT_346031 [Hebeloma cylindrosporum h7]